MHARAPALHRAEVDAAVESGALRVVPALRGCIYLAPADVAPLLMRFAEDRSWSRTERELAKAGASLAEVDALGKAVLAALAAGPMSPDALRQALPKGAVRSLGEAGKKVGLSSPLPVALRRLEFDGLIERTLPDGRLDTERYLWRLVPRAAGPQGVPSDPEGRLTAVAEHFLRCAGPASLDCLAEWAGVSLRDARSAVARLPGRSRIGWSRALRRSPHSSARSWVTRARSAWPRTPKWPSGPR